MMIRGSAAVMFAGGVMLWLMTKLDPFLAVIMMDYVAIFTMAGAIFILLFVFGISGTGKQYDTLSPGSALINYIRRDGMIIPLVGTRIFSGESFLDVPNLGLIEDLGKDTVFTWGRKRVRFGLENINYTPNPKHFNLTHELYGLGFDDNDDLFAVLNIPNIDAVKETAKKTYYLERMGNIYWNMVHQSPRGGKRLVLSFKRKPVKKTVFGKPREAEKKKLVYDELDKVIYKEK